MGEALNQESFALTREGAVVRLLHVEDNPLDVELVQADLDQGGIAYEPLVVQEESAYVRALEQFQPDIVLSDLSMPSFSGMRALELLLEQRAETPFIFVSATLDEEAAVRALQRGATDYIFKQNTARLASAVRRALQEAQEQRARRYAEAELIRAQRFESLAMLAGGLSHDLRNLLQPLLLAGESLQDYKDDPRLARLGNLVRDCGRRGLDMVQSMLSLARGSRLSSDIRLGDLLEALKLLLQGSVPGNIELKFDIADPDLRLEGNYTELQQCLLNLCLNAIQAMPQGGQLTVSSSLQSLQADFFTGDEAGLPGVYLRLVVADTGVGMSKAVKSKLFKPFFTTKDNGTGLGLISCLRIVQNHVGAMRVDSSPGVGSQFQLYLPLTVAQPQESAQAGDGTSLEGEAERVLVVVEEAGRLSLLVDTLDAYGYQASASQSGTAALQWIEAHGVPDVVMLDADMNLFTGVRTLNALVEHGYRGAVILLAQPGQAIDTEQFPDLEYLYVLRGPVDAPTVLRTLRKVLRAASRA